MTSPRNRASRTKGEQQFLRRLNETQVSGPRVMRFAEEVQSLPEAERDFEGIAITVVKFFAGDPDAVLSAYPRMKALAVLVTEGVPGWASDVGSDGGVKTHPSLFEAAGRAPLHWSGNELRFRRASFLRIAFREAKTSS